IAARRAQAVQAARAAAAAAAPFGVRVIVFGSLATGGFHRSSDLDLALDGPEEAMFEAGNAAFAAALPFGFEPDVVELSRVSAGFADRIRKDGRDPSDLE
ncbi:nucleotidyltransferase family protein, partial [Falsiroseomonas oryzae]|uniref:nucleotidyltransferase family protein n=1 Tax=Falsiroseomonas oryzae TaxID=2766473 RepID=UPI0022EA2908